MLMAFIFAKSSIILHEYSHGSQVNISVMDDSDSEKQDCYLCEFAEISSKILMSTAVGVFAFSSYFINILSRLSKFDLAYFLSSKLSRGPPLVV